MRLKGWELGGHLIGLVNRAGRGRSKGGWKMGGRERNEEDGREG